MEEKTLAPTTEEAPFWNTYPLVQRCYAALQVSDDGRGV